MKTASEKPSVPKRRPPAAAKATEWTDDQKQQIAERAYDLFLARGGEHGYHLEDWLKAEAEFMSARATPRKRRALRAQA